MYIETGHFNRIKRDIFTKIVHVFNSTRCFSFFTCTVSIITFNQRIILI
jgi:hypothetical protein